MLLCNEIYSNHFQNKTVSKYVEMYRMTPNFEFSYPACELRTTCLDTVEMVINLFNTVSGKCRIPEMENEYLMGGKVQKDGVFML